MESFGAHDCGQCACGSAYHHRSGLYVQLFFEYSYEWFFSDAGACGFGSGYMVSGTAKGCGEPDTYSHRSGAHFFTASGALLRQWMPENTVTEAGVSA